MEQWPSATDAVREAFARRVRPGQLLSEGSAAIARCCHDMAVRFHRGGTLLVFGNGSASTDAQHIAVEFVHPVIVGKRALPAVSLTNDVATVTGVGRREGFAEVFAHQLRQLATPHDIALGISADGRCENVRRGLQAAGEAGLLTVLLSGGDGAGLLAGDAVDHAIVVRSTDPRIIKELHVTIYHVLWELVHVFFEQPGLLDPPDREAVR